MKSNRWRVEEDLILKFNYYDCSIIGCKNKLSELGYNRTHWSILNRARKLGLKTNNSIVHKTNFYNEDFFSIPNIQNCYWAGFIASDGNISRNKKTIRLHIGYKDIELIEKFKKDTNHTGKITLENACDFYSKKEDKIYHRDNSCSISFNAAYKWSNDLNKYWNITPAKSLTLKPPNITDINLCFAYIIGLIDGDGSIYTHSNCKNPYLCLYGTKEMLCWTKEKLDIVLNYKTNVKVIRPKNRTIYHLRYNVVDANNIINKAKEINTPYKLERKWGK